MEPYINPANQADWNSIFIIILLLLNLFFGTNLRSLFKTVLIKLPVHQYLNTQAKIRAIEYAPSAIITIDSDGLVVAWNGGAVNIFGYKEKEVLGKPLTLIIPEKYREAHLKGIERMKNSYNPPKFIGKTVELEGLRKNGEEFKIEMSLWKWFEAGGVFYTGIIRDIDTEKATEQKIDEIIQMYQRGEEINECGVWSWDVLNDKVVTTKGFNDIFDISENEIDSTYLLKRVYHEDIKTVEAAIKQAFEQKKGYTIQYRVVTRNGTLIKVEICAKPFLNKEGDLFNITGTIRKIH
jgi:PAS domain S-box-containing protein